MQYLLTIYEDESNRGEASPDQLAPMLDAYRRFGEENADAIVGGAGLQPTSTATSVRVRDGERLVTDGPFAETREQLGGYYLIEAGDLDRAIAIAAQIPGASSGTVEVRPLMVFADAGEPAGAAAEGAQA